MAEAKRRLAAILAADVAGYSRLMGDDERATMTTLNAYRAVFKERVSDHEGRVVDMAGDSVLAVFDSVVEAVECAVEVQGELEQRNNELSGNRQMLFRIGVNLGDVIVQDDGTIYGDGVNVAARLEGLAEPGGICLSGSAHEQVEGKTDLDFENIGAHEVKNIARPVRAYRAEIGPTASPSSEKPLALPDKPSIAVLPFTNLSGDPEQEFFGDALAEDLITALSRIRWISVTARNSSFAYKGQAPDIRQVGRDLGARYVIEGSVRKVGARARISGQLIATESGNHLWAAHYDRELADLLAVQDEIAETIVAAVEPELGAAERDRARHRPIDGLDAWDCYQRGLSHLYQYDPEGNAQAKEMFERAIELYPDFGPAHAGLGYTYTLAFLFGQSADRAQCLDDAMATARKAVALDDQDPLAHSVMGRVFTAWGDFDAAYAECRAAIELNRSFALAHYGLGHSLVLGGRPREALPEFKVAAGLSPHDPYLWLIEFMTALAHLLMREHEAAVVMARQAARRPTAGFWAFSTLASALGHLGQEEDARLAIEQLLKSKPDFSFADAEKFAPFKDHAQLEHWIDGLRKAGLDIPDESAAAD